jgi:hypothetical protein
VNCAGTALSRRDVQDDCTRTWPATALALLQPSQRHVTMSALAHVSPTEAALGSAAIGREKPFHRSR